MVELRFSADLGKSSQGFGKCLEGVKDRILRQIKKCDSHVLAMVKALTRKRAVFELLNQFLISHRDGLVFFSVLFQAMAGGRIQLQTVKLFQRL